MSHFPDRTIGQRIGACAVAAGVWYVAVKLLPMVPHFGGAAPNALDAAVAVLTIILIGGLPFYVAIHGFLILLEIMLRTFR